MQSQTFKLLLLALSVSACSGEAEESMEELGTTEQAITVTLDFQDGVNPVGSPATYVGTRDSRLVSLSANTNFGTSTSCLVAGSASGNEQSCVIQFFHLGTFIPASAAIQSVTLFLNITDPSGNKTHFSPLLKTWTESAVTWNNARSGVPWGAPGAKDSSDRGLAFLPPAMSFPGLHAINLGAAGVAEVQEAVSSGDSTVTGFIVSNPTSGNPLGFDTSEAPVVQNRPRLRVTFIN